jgi:hypothetical protein
MGMCEVGPTTQHDFDVVWKDLDFKIKVSPAAGGVSVAHFPLSEVRRSTAALGVCTVGNPPS